NHCGIGWIGTTSSTSGNSGFTVVRRACTGSGQLTFAHELGHNLGSQHDWYMDASGGAFTYGHGFVNFGSRFRDVMAYEDMCTDSNVRCPRIVQYSNPRVTYDGQRTGITAGTSLSCRTGVRPSTDCDA